MNLVRCATQSDLVDALSGPSPDGIVPAPVDDAT